MRAHDVPAVKNTTTHYWESSAFVLGVMAILFFFAVPGGRRKPHSREFANPPTMQDRAMSSQKEGGSFAPQTIAPAAGAAARSTGV
jgi:hypothetical protein